MTEVSIALAFAAGLLSFVTPCVLALLPVYVAFLGEAAATQPARGSGGMVAVPRSAIVPQALLFVGGFSLTFVVVFTSIGLIGAPVFRIPEVRQVAGIAVIALGVLTTGAFGPVLGRLSVDIDSSRLPAARSARSLALGAFMAVGWTPCIGPVLGAIFTMGASSGSAPAVFVLLLAYSAGLAVPFLAAAMALPRLRPVIDVLRRHHRLVRVVSGLFIVAIGVMIFLNTFQRLAGLFTIAL
jgi:cytochrome c-type biogenesis protein